LITIKLRFILLWIVTPLYLIVLYILYLFVFQSAVPLYHILFPAWFLFYYLGLYMRINRKAFSFNMLGLFFCCGIALLLSIWESFMIENYTGLYVWASSQIKVSSFIYSICLIFFILKLHNYVTINNKWILMIGNYSFGIFCIHMLILPVVQKLLLLVISDTMCTYLLIRIIVVITTIILSLLTIKTIERIIGEKNSKLIGLK
jgi:membrane-bound acyltransferase YfiQ involved in biofilm formation